MQSNNTESVRETEISFPYEITFVDCPPSDAVRFQVEEQLDKLGHVYDRIIDCKVNVRIPHKFKAKRLFHIHIQLDVPGKRLAVSRDTPSDARNTVGAAIHDAFHRLTRQLDDFLRIRKDHHAGPQVVVE